MQKSMQNHPRSLRARLYRASRAVCPVVWAALLLAAPLAADPICIPRADGVPEFSDQPPNWWDTSAGANPLRTGQDDPRWRGAHQQTFPLDGVGVATEHVLFRALHRQGLDTSVSPPALREYLYLSWQVKSAPALALDITRLFVGFRNPGGAVQDVAIMIKTTTTSSATATGDYTAEVRTRAPGSSTWTTVDPPPSWVTTPARIWVETAPQGWGVQLRVPLASGLANGIPVGTDFRMWYEARVATPDNPSTPVLDHGEVRYSWPDGQIATFNNPPPPVSGATENWEQFRLAAGPLDPGCSTEGVSLLVEDVGTTNTPPHEINLTSPNTFFARPENQGMATANGVKATFRIADWGIHPITGATTPGLWQGIGTSASENITGGGQGNLTLLWSVSGECERCRYQTYYANHTAACNALSCPDGVNNRRDHQCMLVELDGVGVTFLNASVYNNMEFVEASRFARAAGVFNFGLGGTRDIYLYVETRNMPRRVARERGERPFPVDLPSDQTYSGREQISANGQDVDDAPPATFAELAQTRPTYTVHAYYDTGEREVIEGVDHKILRPMTSFGYFVNHEGELEGWRHALEGAELVTIVPGSFYRITVPDRSSRTIVTTIEAIEPSPWSLSLHAGTNDPRGTIANFLNGDASYGLDIEYRFHPIWAVELFYGRDAFDGDGGFGLDIDHLSLNAKAYFGSGVLQPFVLAGLGLYDFDPGDQENGYDAGAGLQYSFTPRLALGAEGRFHWVDTGPDRFEFLTWHAVLRVGF